MMPNADLILMVGAGMKTSSSFFDVPLVFCEKRDSDVFIKVKLVHRGTNVKTFKGEIIQNCKNVQLPTHTLHLI